MSAGMASEAYAEGVGRLGFGGDALEGLGMDSGDSVGDGLQASGVGAWAGRGGAEGDEAISFGLEVGVSDSESAHG